MLSKSNLAVIGSGFAGLSAAAVLASNNHNVHVFEKNDQVGGRARRFSAEGFLFDMGPSWYWMPDVFEKFFNRFGHSVSQFLELKKLDPGFQIIFGENDTMVIPAEWDELVALFENIEMGSAKKLEKFMAEAKYKYDVGVNDLVYQPGLSLFELLQPKLASGVFKLQVFSSFRKHVRKFFKSPKLIALMEFPVLFLGAMPKDTPALYSLMNYAGLKLGTYYPMGGFGKVIDAMKEVAIEKGAIFHTSEPVSELKVSNGKVIHVSANGNSMDVNGVIGTADYHHIEQSLLPEKFRSYNEAYWDKKVFAPSCLLFYLGVNKKIEKLIHHNLFFDEDLEPHAHEIYKSKQWPVKPLFYVCCPSKTDPEVAPEGMENLFILMPIAPGLQEDEELKEYYFNLMLDRIEKYTGMNIRENIIYNRSYSVSNFIEDYNAYKGNAYGLANTLLQTANLKPRLKSKKLSNLFFAGQLTVPGPGVPPSIISGQVAAKELLKTIKS